MCVWREIPKPPYFSHFPTGKTELKTVWRHLFFTVLHHLQNEGAKRLIEQSSVLPAVLRYQF